MTSTISAWNRVSAQGVKSLGSHFACLCRELDFYEVKKIIIIFQKEKGNTFTLLIIFIVKSLQKEQNSTIYYYDLQSAGINVQPPQSESTPRRLTLYHGLLFPFWFSAFDNKTLTPFNTTLLLFFLGILYHP